jgi:hypothetical protein
MAGAIGCHIVEADALKALSDIAEMRHLHDVAEHRLDRAFDLLRLLPEKERASERVQKMLAKMNDKKISRSKDAITRRKHLLELRETLGVAAAEEEKKITDMYVGVALRRMKEAEKTIKRAKMETLDVDGVFELLSELSGTTPSLSEEELFEAMAQIVGGGEYSSGGAVPDVVESTKVGLEEVVIWWLDGLDPTAD